MKDETWKRLQIARMHEYLLMKQMGIWIPQIDLDAGCGDGYFASNIFSGVRIGLDISNPDVIKARKTGVYENVLKASVTHLPLRDGCLDHVMCNCVLQQVDPISLGVKELARTLSSKGVLISAVINKNFNRWLFFASILPRSLFQSIRRFYIRRLHEHFHHVNFFDFDEWGELLGREGFDVVEHRFYFGRFAFLLFECWTALQTVLANFGFPPSFYEPAALHFVRAMTRLFAVVRGQRVTANEGSCIFIIAKKKRG